MLRPQRIGPVPKATARVAHAAFPHGQVYLQMADELGAVFTDELFAGVYPSRGQPALAPWRLALVTVLQFAEGLSDRRAADAVRSRIDWKYVLRLELTDPGFDASVLSEFRARLLAGDAERLLLDTLLEWCRERRLLTARGQQRTDSTHVLAKVRALNRVEVVGETMRHALNTLAVVAPAWLCAHSRPEWAERYAGRVEDERLPTGKGAREALAATIGADGYALLGAVCAPEAPAWLREVPAVETLRRVWVQNYLYREGAGAAWRTDEGIPPASHFISSPYDLEAHYARKRTTMWVGYKVHLTETCEDDAPHLVTHVETAPGPAADGAATPAIHRALEERDLLPGVHLVDSGYVDARQLVTSRQAYGVDLLGPTRRDQNWQARADEGFDAAHFRLDWAAQQATCPAGRTSLSWTPAVDHRRHDVIKIKFSYKDCGPCPHRGRCIASEKTYQRRTLTVRPQATHQALQAARHRERTPAFRAAYARRAGIEATISRGVRTCRLRRTRYIGLERTHLGHVLTAVALNFLRLGEWFAGIPPAKTRISPFAALVAAPRG
ncbi:MAG: IS1182 family transposase [Chloroflexota bacterium]|nr:IS1182 family transposase [Chloroflexota bacterium]